MPRTKKPSPFDFTEVFTWDEKTKAEKAAELAEQYSAPNYKLPVPATPLASVEGGTANAAPLPIGAGAPPAGLAAGPQTGSGGISPQMQMQLMQMLMQQQQGQQPPPVQLPQLTGGQPMAPPDFFSGLARSR